MIRGATPPAPATARSRSTARPAGTAAAAATAPPPPAIPPCRAPGRSTPRPRSRSRATGGGSVAGTVYSPSSDGATPAAGPFPLIVVSPGFQLARSQYRGFCEHLATWGHVCVARDYASSGTHQDKAREVGGVIDWALSAGSGLASRVDAGKIGVAGHSLGGKVSINAAILDSRIKAVVGWDPVDALPPFGDGSVSVTPELMAGLRVPLAVLGETTDAGGGLGGMSCAPAADNYVRFFEAACQAPATLEVTIAMADHMDWIGDRGSCGLACFACQNGQTPEATVHQITRRVNGAWFRRHLGGDGAMDPWLAADRVGSPTTLRTAPPGC
ncbi:MAG: hypothetical protein HS111_15275 [Kofleriaceae bacterium]|nr:hypothetical protein [Kofleriaceae bacterium]